MSDVAYALATMARDINELRKENKRLRQDLAAARELLREAVDPDNGLGCLTPEACAVKARIVAALKEKK